jgi:MFS family permease
LAWWLLPGWLGLPDGGFARIFAVTAICFVLSALMAALLFEPADDQVSESDAERSGSVADMFRVLRGDANLRRTVEVAMLFGSGLIVAPHYQALALGPMQLPRTQLMVFAVMQSLAVGVYSLFVGPLADKLGNRLTLRVLIFGAAATPVLAIVLSLVSDQAAAAGLYWLVFIPLGITPLAMRILVNYTLETCAREEHPRYLSTVSLAVAVPFLLSPAIGWLVDLIGFQPVFVATAILILLGGLMTFRLDEPRHRLKPEVAEIVEAATQE